MVELWFAAELIQAFVVEVTDSLLSVIGHLAGQQTDVGGYGNLAGRSHRCVEPSTAVAAEAYQRSYSLVQSPAVVAME